MVEIPERFSSKFEVLESGCWQWMAGIMSKGYGNYWNGSSTVLAHRFSYELFVGPIPTGLQIDHLCRNHACVNPNHLEAVTQRENLLRGENQVAVNSKKTHCPQGHEYTQENTYRHPNRPNKRQCRICQKRKILLCGESLTSGEGE